MHKHKVAIVGCGQIASGFEEDLKREHPCTHAGVYNFYPKTKIVSAADIDKNALNKFSKKWGVKDIYLDYNEMLRKEKINILSVCTNTSFHIKVVLDATKSGVKAVFCEKPIASSLGEADKMIEECKKNNVHLTINHTRRWDSYYNKVKEMVEIGVIGKITSIVGHYESGLMIMGTHMFDIMRFFCGDVEWVVGETNQSKYLTHDPTGSGYLHFKNGVKGYVVGHTGKNYSIFEIDIVGTGGRIRISNNGKKIELWKPRESKYYSDYIELVQENVNLGERNNMMVKAVEDVVRSLEKNKETKCTGDDGRAALELALAIQESSRNKNIKITLPLKNRRLKISSR